MAMVQKEMTQLVESSSPFTQPQRPWRLILLLLAGLGAGTVFAAYLTQPRSPTPPPVPAVKASPTPNVRAVAALGRLEPEGEITRLSAYNSVEGARIDELRVQEGDTVRVGQVVATLTTQNSRKAALFKAQTQVQAAQAQVARVKAGAKAGDISAQQAAIARLQAEIVNAQLEYDRNQALFEQGAISASSRDSKELALSTLRAQLNQTQANLTSVAEVRPEDVRVAQADVETAIAAVKAAETDLEITNIRAPITGQVLKIHARPGEIVGADGIAEIAKTDTMYAVTEVYETDIQKIKIGQKANITSSAVAGTLTGTVAKVGLQVERQGTFNINPLAKTDSRVIEVKIALSPESSQRVAGLTNLQVQVIFQK